MVKTEQTIKTIKEMLQMMLVINKILEQMVISIYLFFMLGVCIGVLVVVYFSARCGPDFRTSMIILTPNTRFESFDQMIQK